MSSLDNNLSKNPISPKVSVPFLLGLLVIAAETAATKDWSEANWLGSALVVIYAAVGYLVNDPNRITD